MNENWKYVPFEQLFEWDEKSTIGSRQGKESGKYRLYVASAKEIKYFDEFLSDGESLVFGTGGNPCIHFVTGKYAYTNHTESAKCKNSGIVDTKFYYYYFQKDRYSELQSTFVGGGIKNSSKKRIGSLIVPVPPLEEQHRIVTRIEELFSQLDSGVETLKKTREQLKVYRQAVLKEAFDNIPDSICTTFGDTIIDKPRNGYSPKGVDYKTKYKNLTLTATTSGKFISKELCKNKSAV